MAQSVQTPRSAKTSASMARALVLAGRKWTLRIVWELRVGPLSFRGLRAACGNVSPSVLADRLRELGDTGSACSRSWPGSTSGLTSYKELAQSS
jgi:DNA-binding HxlR family transcriptional regulator